MHPEASFLGLCQPAARFSVKARAIVRELQIRQEGIMISFMEALMD
jgi:hypothetical protein